MKTKFSKTFDTYVFPVGNETLGIVEEWVDYLKDEKPWGNDDPLFPATRIALGTNRQFVASELDRAYWSSASPIRGIFREAFERAGLPCFNPHSFRNMLVRLGEGLCHSPKEFKAWSHHRAIREELGIRKKWWASEGATAPSYKDSECGEMVPLP